MAHNHRPPPPPVHHHHLLLLLLLTAAPYAGAQPSTPSGNNYNGFGTASFNSTTAIVLVVLISAFFFLAFLSIYFRRCSFHRPSTDAFRVFAEGGRRSRRTGLDPALLETFPTMVYSEVKGLRTDKVALECAVCLSEFGDDETLRMLPGCSHAFHPSCIDTWLASHVTCPVCRSNLTEVHEEEQDDAVAEAHAVVNDVGPDEEAGREREQEEVERVITPAPGRFRRSHTTGNSVERPGDGLDRYTLRLPEHVWKDIVAAGKLRRASSCVGFPDGGEASGRTVGEGSGREGSSMRMTGRSDRWAPAFLARAFSARVVPTWKRGEGERSVKKGEAAEGVATIGAPKLDGVAGGGGRSDSGEGDSESSTTPLDRV